MVVQAIFPRCQLGFISKQIVHVRQSLRECSENPVLLFHGFAFRMKIDQRTSSLVLRKRAVQFTGLFVLTKGPFAYGCGHWSKVTRIEAREFLSI